VRAPSAAPPASPTRPGPAPGAATARAVARGALCAGAAALALLAVDVVRTALLEPRVAGYGAGDLAWAFASWARWSLPLPLAAGAVVGALLAATRGRIRRRWRAWLLGALAVPYLVYAIVYGTRGAWISSLPGVTLLRLAAVTGGAGGLGYAALLALRHEARGGAALGRLLAAAAALAAAAGVAADLRVEVGRYPTLHQAVTLGAVAGLGYLAHRAATPRRARPLAASALAVLAAVGAAAAVTGLIAAPARDRLARGAFVRLARVTGHLGRPVLALGSAPSPLDDVRVDPALLARLRAGPRLGPPPLAARPDIVFVTICTARADHVGFLGYARDTTPNLDRLAGEATVFERAYTPASKTLLSLLPAMSGRTAPGVYLPHFAGAGRPPVLRSLLEDAGYLTFGGEDLAAARAAAGGDRPVFLHAHLGSAHAPYDPRDPRYGDGRVDRYDAGLREVDARIGRLLAAFPGAVVAVLNDHGEEFGDRGSWFHGFTLYDELVRAVLVVRVPGAPPRRVAQTVSTADVTPTLLELAGVDPPSGMHAWSLTRAVLAGEVVDRPPVVAIMPTSFFASDWEPPARVLAMVVRDGWKLIYDARVQAVELYDLSRDPPEHADLAAREPARVRALLRVLKTYRAAIAEQVGAPEAWFR